MFLVSYFNPLYCGERREVQEGGCSKYSLPSRPLFKSCVSPARKCEENLTLCLKVKGRANHMKIGFF